MAAAMMASRALRVSRVASPAGELPVFAPRINLNIDAGLLTLMREDGKKRRYRRTEDKFSVDHQPIHAMQDAIAKNRTVGEDLFAVVRGLQPKA